MLIAGIDGLRRRMCTSSKNENACEISRLSSSVLKPFKTSGNSNQTSYILNLLKLLFILNGMILLVNCDQTNSILSF